MQRFRNRHACALALSLVACGPEDGDDETGATGPTDTSAGNTDWGGTDSTMGAGSATDPGTDACPADDQATCNTTPGCIWAWDRQYSGHSVSGAGDVNGDGLADLIVGAPYASFFNGYESGRSYVVFGKADTDLVQLSAITAGARGFALDGEAEGDRSGWSVSRAGDVNGDGLPDLIVGAPFASFKGNESGRSYVVFGKADTDKVLLSDITAGTGGFALDGEAEGDCVASGRFEPEG